MFNSFVRAVSGLNPFGKAAETTNDIVVIPVGGMNEATLNNEGEPQQAPPERERRQVRGGRPNRRDLEVEEVYYEAEDSQDDLFANIRDVRQFEKLENVREGYYRPRPGDVDTRDRDVISRDQDPRPGPVQGQFQERQKPQWQGYVPSPIGPDPSWGSVYPGHHYSPIPPAHFSPSTPWQMTYGRYPGDMATPWRYPSPMMYPDPYMGVQRYPNMPRDWGHFSGPNGMPMPWDCNAPLAATDVHTSLPRDVIWGTSNPMAGGVTLQERETGRQAPGGLGMSYGMGDPEVRAPSTQINMGAQESNLGVGMLSTPDQREFSHVEMSRNSRLLSESVTAPTNVACTVGAGASAARISVSRNSPVEAPVSVVPDTPLPLHAGTDTLQCVSSASASTSAVVMQTGQDTVAGAQASVVSVPSSHRSDPAVTQINDGMAQTSPAVPGLNYNVFPVLPQGKGSGPSSNAAGSGGCKRLNHKPEKYDGVSDWADYIRHFEMVSAWNGWTVEEKAVQLTINLTGIARQAWVDSFCDSSTPISYESLVVALTQRFKPDGQQEAYKAEFRHRTRKRDESFMEYGYALKRLAIRAFPKITHEAREDLIVDQFLQGLADAEMRRHISLTHPSGVDQAVGLATEYETVSQSIRTPQTHKPKQVAAVKGTNESRTDQLLEKILGLVTPRAEQPGTERPRFRNRSTVVCYECGQTGHIKRFCGGRGDGSGGADGGKPYNYGASVSTASIMPPASTDAQTSAAPDARTSAPQGTTPTVSKSASAPAVQNKNPLNR